MKCHLTSIATETLGGGPEDLSVVLCYEDVGCLCNDAVSNCHCVPTDGSFVIGNELNRSRFWCNLSQISSL